MNYLYIVDHWVPFPSSEYGGLVVYVAKTDEEVINMIVKDSDPYDLKHYPDYYEKIKRCVCDGVKLSSETLANMPSQKLDEFKT